MTRVRRTFATQRNDDPHRLELFQFCATDFISDCPAYAKARPVAPSNAKRGDASAQGAAHSNWRRVFAAPLCLAAASSLGFIAAFLWGDIGRYLSGLGIGLPLIVIAWVAPSRLFSRTVPR
jgi:hypothetical protein